MRGILPGKGGSRRLTAARTILAAGIALALAACGNLSLVDTLHQEDPGELRFSPGNPVIAVGADLTISVMGGITPYSIVTGAVTPVDEHTWEFPATSTGNFPVQVSDGAGKTVETIVTVYSGGEPVLNVTEVTLPEGVGWTFTVSGGVPPYGWELDGVLQPAGASPNDFYNFPPSSAGTFVVDVLDSAGVSQAATVAVVPSGVGDAALRITPNSAVVMTGGTVAFTALGGDGNYVFSAPDGGSIDSANPATYVAPGTVGTYGVDLTDGSGLPGVSASVTVTATGTLLVLSPGSVSVSVIGDEVQFSASGGTPPYTYSSGKPALGSIDPSTGLYRQLAAGNVVVTVEDSAGLKDNTLVKWDP